MVGKDFWVGDEQEREISFSADSKKLNLEIEIKKESSNRRTGDGVLESIRIQKSKQYKYIYSDPENFACSGGEGGSTRAGAGASV